MTTITNKTNEKVIDKIINFDETLIKAPTGIKGFDEITFGGIPRNRPSLVVGGIGSGKTFFSMQFILKGITEFNEPGVFMTFEEKANELLTNVSNLGYDLKKLINSLEKEITVLEEKITSLEKSAPFIFKK